MSRSLRSYYAGQRDAVKEKLSNGTYPANWPYRRFFQHEEALRGIGDRFNTQMALTPRPAELVALYTNNSGSRLVKPHFGHQCASLYDCFLAPDILGLRAAYMEYSGWDSHRNQKASLENNFNDVFGTGGGLATLMSQLASIPGATDNIVFMFSTDFGRQIKANGTNGTDHGNGNYSILVGKSINGGLTHGEMFPDREANPEHPDNIGKVIPFQKQGADILGRTSAKRILYEATNWAHPGIASSVVPGTGFEVEGGPGGAVDQALDKLFI